MNEILAKYISERNKKISTYLKSNRIEAYRAYDFELKDFPVNIDIYGKYAHIAIYEDSENSISEEIKNTIQEAIRESLHITVSHQIWKYRKQQKGKSQYEKLGHKKNLFTIKEYKSEFFINLTDYLDTGLFLDHRETRQLVAKLATNKERLLNLFSYTASFSVVAANAGIRFTTSVDMSNTYTEWAKENFRLNKMNTFDHIAIRENVFIFLDTAKKKRWKYDLIIIDPPTFSNSKKMRSPFDVQKDYPKLINTSLELLNDDGILLFSTNYKKFQLDDEKILARKIHDITKETIPIDFSDSNIHKCFMITKKEFYPLHISI
ncbi:MAG: class I SAM-dependent methyltransferase [Leptospiraceae bacterium]|nr:class I SAM-dependent methyltransferase [Leptospiraceae bacterium]MCK6381150.1 class I SAM-dependent methyltransferase [Leptospiraceae bacterium]NUM42101.1 class I SAM-dependent methyltransferase [Leptospiraceae bacterium]